MKVFFDTNAYVAEALLGEPAIAMFSATVKAGWRIIVSDYVLDELVHVLIDYRKFSNRFAQRTRRHAARRAQVVDSPSSRHFVPDDQKDNPILAAAISAGADYLVTNDRHLLTLNPYEHLRIISMHDYIDLLISQGLLPRPA